MQQRVDGAMSRMEGISAALHNQSTYSPEFHQLYKYYNYAALRLQLQHFQLRQVLKFASTKHQTLGEIACTFNLEH